MCPPPTRRGLLVLLFAIPGCWAGEPGSATGAMHIDAVMADPRDVADARGEWVRLRNAGTVAVQLRGWTLASGNDAPHRIADDVIVPAGARVTLSRSARTAEVAYVYGAGLSLANRDDWIALRDPSGRTTDSVAWTAARRGVAMKSADLRRGGSPPSASSGTTPPARPAGRIGPATIPPPVGSRSLVVRVLDVGQGDAIYIENGGSRALIDGGADPAVLGRHLDRLALDGGTVDVVIVTHAHLDHYNGLRELFRSRRDITVRYLFDSRDPSPNRTLADLRDSVAARVRRGQLDARDADDPCGDGRPACTITFRGGARLQVWRPSPVDSASPNNRSVAVRLVSADSGFTMWLAGDAEREAIAWMESRGYPLRADVLKGHHHGSCDGTSASYLRRVSPGLVVMSLAARNDYGYVHAQTTRMLRDAGVPWLRTDQNGTITITAPGRNGTPWEATVERGGFDARGPADRVSRDEKCRR